MEQTEEPTAASGVGTRPQQSQAGRLSAPTARRQRAGSRLDLPAVLLAALFTYFFIIHLRDWVAHPGTPVGLGLVILEGLQASLFIVRRREIQRTQRSLVVWLATGIGSWGVFAYLPSGYSFFHAPPLFASGPLLGLTTLWLALQFVGVILAMLSLGSLGRSFGLLAGNRGIRSSGAYRVVRHPTYASYIITNGAYVLQSFSLWNVIVFFIVQAAQVLRILQEEQALSRDPAYQVYRQKVRYRLLPGVF